MFMIISGGRYGMDMAGSEEMDFQKTEIVE
jgi:hypothetical protein